MAGAADVWTAGRRLRVALLVGSPRVGAWVARALELVRASAEVEIALAIVDPAAPPDDGRPRVSGALALHRRADDRVFGAADALALRDLGPLLAGVPAFAGSAREEAGADVWPRASLERVRAEGVDVAVALSLRPQRAEAAGVAGHGLLGCYVGADASGGVSEVFARASGTETGVRAWLPGARGPETRIRAVAPTDAVSPRRGLGTLLAHTAELPLRALRDLARGRTVPRLAPAAPLATGTGAPGAARVAAGTARVLARIARRRAMRALFHETWEIGVRRGGDLMAAANVRFFATTPDRFHADPFAIERDGRTYLYFEELRYARGLGHIACAELLPDGTLGEPAVALERDWHLSYPFLFEQKGELYLLPESGAAGRLDLYRCVEFPARFEHRATLLEGVAAFDPTLHHDGERLWLFAAIAPPGGSSTTDLHLFSAPDVLGPWTPHPENPVVSDARAGRPAGALFREGHAWIRPAQDCAREYGEAIRLQRILRLDPLSYEEEETGRIVPTSWRQVGIHTVNRAGEVAAYDRRTLVSRWRMASCTPWD